MNDEHDFEEERDEEREEAYGDEQEERHDKEPAEQSAHGTISADLIRGHINTIILRTLDERDKYGYEIINEIEEKSHGQYTLKQPTLYSALKRLESQGYIKAYWKTDEVTSGGRRKYFTLTELGREFSEKNQSEWEYSRTVIDSLISDRSFDFSRPAPTSVDFNILKKSVTRVYTGAGRDAATDYEDQIDENVCDDDYAKNDYTSEYSAIANSQLSEEYSGHAVRDVFVERPERMEVTDGQDASEDHNDVPLPEQYIQQQETAATENTTEEINPQPEESATQQSDADQDKQPATYVFGQPLRNDNGDAPPLIINQEGSHPIYYFGQQLNDDANPKAQPDAAQQNQPVTPAQPSETQQPSDSYTEHDPQDIRQQEQPIPPVQPIAPEPAAPYPARPIAPVQPIMPEPVTNYQEPPAQPIAPEPVAPYPARPMTPVQPIMPEPANNYQEQTVPPIMQEHTPSYPAQPMAPVQPNTAEQPAAYPTPPFTPEAPFYPQPISPAPQQAPAQERYINPDDMPYSPFGGSQDFRMPYLRTDNTTTEQQPNRELFATQPIPEQPADTRTDEEKRITHENFVKLMNEPMTDKNIAPNADEIDAQKLIYTNRPETERDYKKLVGNMFDNTIKRGGSMRKQQGDVAEEQPEQPQNIPAEQFISTPVTPEAPKQPRISTSLATETVIEKAKLDGLKVNIAANGGTHTKSARGTTFNKGKALFISSGIVAVMMLIEFGLCMLLMDRLRVGAMYPVTILLIAVAQLAVFGVLYATGYGKGSVRPATHGYILVCAVLTIIAIIIVCLVSFLLDVNMQSLRDIAVKLVIPAGTSLFITVFGVCYYFMSRTK